jgi:uncharacterized protein YceK
MKLILALAIVALASGCASVPMQKAETAPVAAVSSTSCDYDKMRAIDRSAQARVYMYVGWLHCPTIGERDRAKS